MIIVIYCVVYKFELLVLDVVKFMFYFLMFEEIIKSIFNFYYFFIKRRRELVEIVDLLFIMFINYFFVKVVRWVVSKFRVLLVVKKNFVLIVLYIEDVVGGLKDVKIKGKVVSIYKEIIFVRFVKMFYFMLDLMDIIIEIFKIF